MKGRMTQRGDQRSEREPGPTKDEFFKELRKAPTGAAEWLVALFKSGQFEAVRKLPPKDIREHFNRWKRENRAAIKLAGGAL